MREATNMSWFNSLMGLQSNVVISMVVVIKEHLIEVYNSRDIKVFGDKSGNNCTQNHRINAFLDSKKCSDMWGYTVIKAR